MKTHYHDTVVVPSKLIEDYKELQSENAAFKELCRAMRALLDNIMSDMIEEGGQVWYTNQIEDLIKQSEELLK